MNKSKLRIRLLLLLLLGTANCHDMIEEKCSRACKRYVGCTSENFKGNAPSSVLDSIEIQCMDVCTREQSLLSCHDESEDSCKKYARCILHSGLFLE